MGIVVAVTTALTVKAAAARLGWSTSTLIRATNRGEVECWRTPGGHRRIPVAAVERILAERCPDKLEAS